MLLVIFVSACSCLGGKAIKSGQNQKMGLLSWVHVLKSLENYFLKLANMAYHISNQEEG